MTSPTSLRPRGVRRNARGEVVLVQGGADVASWPLWVDGDLDLSVVDRLALMQMAAGRTGCSIRLRHACPHLVALLDLVGLADLLVAEPAAEDPPPSRTGRAWAR